MKALIVFSLLAALILLPFSAASPAKLDSRQESPAVLVCTQNVNCTNAVSFWNDCQTATSPGLEQAPNSYQRNCLCNANQGTPSHPDWFSKLESCIRCVDNAWGFEPAILFLLERVEAGFCTYGNVTYDDFMVQAHNIAVNAGFPLELPQATYVATQTLMSTPGAAASSTAPPTSQSPACSPHIKSITSSSAGEVSTVASSPALTPTSIPVTSTAPASITSAMSALITSATASVPVVKNCNYDNCLRQAIQSEGAVLGFCYDYTAATQTLTTGYPGFVSMCNNSPSSISSACTCIASVLAHQSVPASTQGTATASQVTSNGGVATSETSPPKYGHTMTHTITSWIMVTIGHTTVLASTSCTDDTLTASVIFGTASSSTIVSSAAPSSTTWVTLPASDAIKACVASADCVSANTVYYECINANVGGNQTGSWDCFCQANVDAWKTSVTHCASCLVQSLPANPAGGNNPTSQLLPKLTLILDGFCNETDSGFKSISLSRLDQIGYDITTLWESPINFFGMTLLDQPPPFEAFSSAPVGVSTIVVSTTSSTTVATVTSSSSFSSSKEPASSKSTSSTSTSSMAPTPVASVSSRSTTSTPTTLSTQTTSSAQPTSTNWITLPATQAMKQCQANDCKAAGQIFQTCIGTPYNGTNQTPVLHCFCTTNVTQWQSSLTTCTTCIAAALPAVNPNVGLYQASNLTAFVSSLALYYCQQSAKIAPQAISVMEKFGQLFTSSFELPILLFNMTLLTAPIAGPAGGAAIMGLPGLEIGV